MNNDSRLMNRAISHHFKTLQTERRGKWCEINTSLRRGKRGISRYFRTGEREVNHDS